MRRSLLSLTLVLAACFGLDEKDQLRLTTFKVNSKRFYEAEQFLRAENACRRGLEIDPDDLSLHQVLGFSLLRQRSWPKLIEAEEVFQRCLELEDDFDPRTRLGLGEVHLQLALFLGDRIAALEADETLLPDDRRRRIAAAEDERERHFAASEAALDEVLDSEAGRDDVVAMSTLARLYSVRERYEEAVAVLRRMNAVLERSLRVRRENVDVEKIPEQRRPLWNRMLTRLEGQLVEGLGLEASVAARVGNWEQVISAYARLEALDRMKPADYYNRALAYEALGSRQAAIENYETFVRLAAGKGMRFSDRVAHAMERAAALRAGGAFAPPHIATGDKESKPR